MIRATAVSHPNIAFIKYWGNRDEELRIPVNGSISMNLAGLETQTSVELDPKLKADELTINTAPADAAAQARVSKMLDRVRSKFDKKIFMRIESTNNFPAGAGIASSAAAFAALALAASKAAGLNLSERELSRLARRGSGSAARSIPGGFVEWQAGQSDEDSFAKSIAAADHWDLADCIAIVDSAYKKTGSTAGHALASSSPLHMARVADTPRRLDICRRAILERDFTSLASIIELDSDMMHAVMMTSVPPLMYWQPATVNIFHEVRAWRADGLSVAYTVDAGPNVHVICPHVGAQETALRLKSLPAVREVLVAGVGGPARLA